MAITKARNLPRRCRTYHNYVAFSQDELFQEMRRAEQERQRAEQLAMKLRELGIDPDTI
jgi:hypothetical protein